MTHGTRALSVVATVAFALVLTILLGGCSTLQQRAAVRSQLALEAGAEVWDGIVDMRLAECEAKQLQSESARAICIAPTEQANDAVEVALVAAVAALRAYWTGVAVGESPARLEQHLAAFAFAVAGLPREAFGGLLRGAR